MEKMVHRLKTPKGKALNAPRKQTPEPVFGIIKSVMGFDQFLLRGCDNSSVTHPDQTDDQTATDPFTRALCNLSPTGC